MADEPSPDLERYRTEIEAEHALLDAADAHPALAHLRVIVACGFAAMDDNTGNDYCFFCGEGDAVALDREANRWVRRPLVHLPDCAYVAAKAYVDSLEGAS